MRNRMVDLGEWWSGEWWKKFLDKIDRDIMGLGRNVVIGKFPGFHKEDLSLDSSSNVEAAYTGLTM